MKVPTIEQVEKFLLDAEELNPGPWVLHNRVAGICAKTIAEHCDDIDSDVAQILGMLHDIGRRYGVTDMKHILDGYNYMMEQGFEHNARICLSHSFPYKDVKAYNGQNDCNELETKFIQDFINNIEYNDYDRLIQLCDAISFPTGATFVEKRLVDVVLRRGFNDLTIPKWKAFLELKTYFDKKTDQDIYKLLSV